MQLRKSALWKHYIRRQDPKIFEKYKTVRNKVGSYTRMADKGFRMIMQKHQKSNPKPL